MWLETDHEWLFYVNNDVLVPDGAIDAMAQAMTETGAPFRNTSLCQVCWKTVSLAVATARSRSCVACS